MHGQVQGVFFRDSLRRLARDHGVAGWVCNRADGAVEAVLEAPGEAVEKLIRFCETGPPRARVERIDVHDERPEGLSEFRIR